LGGNCCWGIRWRKGRGGPVYSRRRSHLCFGRRCRSSCRTSAGARRPKGRRLCARKPQKLTLEPHDGGDGGGREDQGVLAMGAMGTVSARPPLAQWAGGALRHTLPTPRRSPPLFRTAAGFRKASNYSTPWRQMRNSRGSSFLPSGGSRSTRRSPWPTGS